MVIQSIKVKFTGTYATETGEPIFSASVRYVDPHPCFWWYRVNHPNYRYWVEYDLMYSIAPDAAQGVGMVWAFNSNGIRSDYMVQFTLQTLQNHETELVWH